MQTFKLTVCDMLHHGGGEVAGSLFPGRGTEGAQQLLLRKQVPQLFFIKIKIRLLPIGHNFGYGNQMEMFIGKRFDLWWKLRE